MIKEKSLEKLFSFVGFILNREFTRYLQGADLFVKMSHTGSLDKAVLEATSSGIIVWV